MKTKCKNWELNFKCIDGCGMGIFNATKKVIKCPECGGKIKQINPLNSRRTLQNG